MTGDDKLVSGYELLRRELGVSLSDVEFCRLVRELFAGRELVVQD